MKAVEEGERAEQVIVDVRTPEEFTEGHVEGAVNINVSDPQFVENVAARYSTDTPIVVYCRSGNRSASAARQLEQAGFENVTDAGSVLDILPSLRLTAQEGDSSISVARRR